MLKITHTIHKDNKFKFYVEGEERTSDVCGNLCITDEYLIYMIRNYLKISEDMRITIHGIEYESE